ncbi:MAG: hypothetical protein ABS863_00280 [Aerococcus urinaeequi]
MKTKLEMAHEWYMMQIRRNGCALVADAWKYADAMQAEADKRDKEEAFQKRKAIREMINADNIFLEKEGQHFDDVEWQPDWSKAPEGYNYWALDGFSKIANWYKDKPYLDEDSEIEDEWNAELGKYCEAPSFNYQGDWRNSLRKRPN